MFVAVLQAVARRASHSTVPDACGAIVAGLLLIGTTALAPADGLAADTADLAKLKALYRRPAAIPTPADNPITENKTDLGQKLFFDPRLSGTSTMSCASCHNPSLAWGDGLATAVGSAGNHLPRRSPTILNLAWAETLFWDGRAETLEEQAVGPIQAAGEMNQAMPKLLASLKAMPDYRDDFEAAFPGEAISQVTVAKAIATFERTVVSAKAPFDRWIEGDDHAIDASAQRGFVTFNGKAHCAACHSGWRFTDDSFNDIGLPGADLGRGALVNGVEPLQHAFKTPSLRNVSRRAPFMHDGSVATLTEVIHHYDGGFEKRPSLSADIFKLALSDQEVNDLVAFMKALTSDDAMPQVPVLPTKVVD